MVMLLYTTIIANNMNIDKWFMVQCNENEYDYEWGIDDPRCREIIREKFGIDTVEYDTHSGGKRWEALTLDHHDTGNTIKEAEVTLLKSIYKYRNKH